jgi:hypothetical protein
VRSTLTRVQLTERLDRTFELYLTVLLIARAPREIEGWLPESGHGVYARRNHATSHRQAERIEVASTLSGCSKRVYQHHCSGCVELLRGKYRRGGAVEKLVSDTVVESIDSKEFVEVCKPCFLILGRRYALLA